MIIVLVMRPATVRQPVLQILLFCSQICAHREKVLKEIIPSLRHECGDGMDLEMLDVGDPANRLFQLNLESATRSPVDRRSVVSAILIGRSLDGDVQDVLLTGFDSIVQHLVPVVPQDSVSGSVSLPCPPPWHPGEAAPATDGHTCVHPRI
jgi:hypothetical protein